MEESYSKANEHRNAMKGYHDILKVNGSDYCQSNLEKYISSNIAWNQEVQNYMQVTRMYFSL